MKSRPDKVGTTCPWCGHRSVMRIGPGTGQEYASLSEAPKALIEALEDGYCPHECECGRWWTLRDGREVRDEEAEDMNKITPEHIDSIIVDVETAVYGNLTICVLTLENGFKLTGESSCVDAANFNAEIGIKLAIENAKDKVWLLEGYLLKQRLYEAEPPDS